MIEQTGASGDRAWELWCELVMPDAPETKARAAFSDAFIGWGSDQNEGLWSHITGRLRTERVQAAAAGPDSAEKLTALLAGFDELLGLADQARTEHEAGPDQHARAVSKEMESREGQSEPTGLIGEYVGQELSLKVKALRLDRSAAEAVGVAGKAAATALTEAVGTDRRVDRIDSGLLEAVQQRALTLLREAGIEVSRTSGTRAVPANAVVNAALAMVLRAGGVPGIELSEHGELLCAVLASDGDLARTATIDARLSVLGAQLGRMESTLSRAEERTRRIEAGTWLSNMIGGFALAERLKIVKVRGVGAEAAADVSVADPAVVSFLGQLADQAGAEQRRRIDEAGRPSKHAAVARKGS